jgi:ABC-type phosphate/phosphonate transport system substrate-binding protein
VAAATIVWLVSAPRAAEKSAKATKVDRKAGGDCPECEACQEGKVVRLGAVAYSPDAVTVFQNLRFYLKKNKYPVDYVLYSSYDELVKALHKGDVDIAWNSPLAHGKYHLLAGGKSQALVMRDVDCGYSIKLIVRKDAGVCKLSELKGKTMVFGSCDAAEATVLPRYFLAKDGVDFKKDVKVLSLHDEVDDMGCPCHSEHHVLKALIKGRGQAGIISTGLWNRLAKDEPKEAAKFTVLWTSPKFSHCVWTAKATFDKGLGDRFTKLMTTMDKKNPVTAQVLNLEYCGKWVKGGQEGYADLLKALEADQKTVAIGKK